MSDNHKLVYLLVQVEHHEITCTTFQTNFATISEGYFFKVKKR